MERYYSQGWRSVCAGIQGAETILDGMEREFIACMSSGETLGLIETKLVLLLSKRDWRWPWLDMWELRFNEAGQWPYMWRDFYPEDEEDEDLSPEGLEEYRRAAVAPLVAHTAMTTSYRLRDLDRVFRIGDHVRLVGHGDPGESWAARSYPGSFVLTNDSQLPPFFPGDRTSITRPLRTA